jgi:hypothetical protein
MLMRVLSLAAAGVSFVASTDEALRLLPDFVQQAFPLKLTKKGAITLDLLDHIENDVLTTGNFTAASARVKEMSTQHYHKTQVGCDALYLLHNLRCIRGAHIILLLQQ